MPQLFSKREDLPNHLPPIKLFNVLITLESLSNASLLFSGDCDDEDQVKGHGVDEGGSKLICYGEPPEGQHQVEGPESKTIDGEHFSETDSESDSNSGV